MVSRSAYDAYGNPSVVQSGPMSRYGYVGKGGYAQDGATDLLLCGARFYLPAVGRFLVPDPIGHDGGLNLYAYCDDNPVGKSDPSGHQGYSVGQYLGDVGGVLLGYGSAAWGALRSPYDIANFLGNWAGSDWSSDFGKRAAIGAWGQFYSGIAGERGSEGFGESFGSLLIAAGSAGSGFAEGGMFSKMAYITRWDTVAGLEAMAEGDGVIKAGAFVQRGQGNLLDWGLSGAAERYPYNAKMTMLVPKSILRSPRGFEMFKYLLRQRTLTETYHF